MARLTKHKAKDPTRKIDQAAEKVYNQPKDFMHKTEEKLERFLDEVQCSAEEGPDEFGQGGEDVFDSGEDGSHGESFFGEGNDDAIWYGGVFSAQGEKDATRVMLFRVQ